MITQKKILIAPLDWGMGHTTRCFPLVEALLQQGHEVLWAAEGHAATFIHNRFPQLQILPLQGYRIHYNKERGNFALAIANQIPKILKAINYEYQWLQNMQSIYHFDAIISDNRYGLYHENVRCIIMTHQLQILTGKGLWVDKILQKINYRFLSRFNKVWIVDNALPPYLSGKLGHPIKLPKNAVYIGLLSQLKVPEHIANTNENNILILLSGPEPQRSILQEKLLQQAQTLNEYNFQLVAGNPSSPTPNNLPKHIQFFTHFNSEEVAMAMQDAALVIGRSGYSTLMDLCQMQKKALLIPTPGQTEQEYLAQYLEQNNIAIHTSQEEILLKVQIPEAFAAKGFDMGTIPNGAALQSAILSMFQ